MRDTAGALIALTRPVSAAMEQCELTHIERLPIDIDRARAQHDRYCKTLEDAGCRVIELPAADDLPDSVFIEDTAVVLDELAIVTRPGAPARRPEVAAVAAELALHRSVVTMREPATLDGGDVLRVGRTLYVGASGRSNAAGIDTLRAAVAPIGYRVVAVPLEGCLHLKTAVTALLPDLLLLNPEWVNPSHFEGMRWLATAPGEPFAANALPIGDRVIYPDAFPVTMQRLREAGLDLMTVNVSELARAEGGVTCCSVILSGEV